MGKSTTPILKRCKKLGLNPLVLGYGKVSKRNQKETRRKKSEYALQLDEKQKLRFIYGVLERQFRLYYEMAVRKPGVTGEVMLQLLESRLDNVVYRLGFAKTRNESKQLVSHGHITVNGKKVDIPSYLVKAGDVITVKSRSSKFVQGVMDSIDLACAPAWMTIDKSEFKIVLDRIPEREELDPELKEQLVIEYYSK
jgi:small subunit ribosomal protein S4